MKSVFICKLGTSPLKFILGDTAKVSDLLSASGITLASGEVVKSVSTEETINSNDLLEDEENYVIVREMKNA